MGKLFSIFYTNEKLIIIIFSFFKSGFVKTGNNTPFKGISIVFGIWRIEFQFNISYVQDLQIKIPESEYGKA